MEDKESRSEGPAVESTEEISKFAQSYASFNRVIDSLQQKYHQLQEEFSTQNEQLARANRKLTELSEQNLLATEFLNNILDSIPAGVIAVDRDGTITHFNPAASVILGIPQKVTLGRHYRDVLPPGDPPDANAYRAAETGRSVESAEKKLVLGDNTTVLVSVSTSILRNDAGERVGAVEVVHDLTKLKKMELELARLNTMAALGQMAATIAHEVRNPLLAIAGFASLLERDMQESDPKRDLVRKIIRGVESLNETVETLLNYSRFEEMNKAETDYADFLRGALQQFYHDNAEIINPGQISIVGSHEEAAEPAAISVVVDRLLYRQVLYNLFTNGLEALRGQGHIEVSFRKLSRRMAAETYRTKLLLGVDETVLETVISDDGPGIPAEHLERIFAPFFTTKAEGNGLGLAVAWKIMKAHGGDIIAENRPEGGARFRLLIPVRVDTTRMEREA